MKYDIAKETDYITDGKTVKGRQRITGITGKERIKESFHPVVNHSVKSLVKRKLIKGDFNKFYWTYNLQLTKEGIETVKELTKNTPLRN